MADDKNKKINDEELKDVSGGASVIEPHLAFVEDEKLLQEDKKTSLAEPDFCNPHGIPY